MINFSLLHMDKFGASVYKLLQGSTHIHTKPSRTTILVSKKYINTTIKKYFISAL